MAHPTEEQINLFCEFTGEVGAREKAILFIRGNNGDTEKAISAWLEDQNPQRYESQVRYDESQFSSDRQGAAEGTQSQPFQLDDDLGTTNPQFGSLTAPSRPPSRHQPIGPQLPPGYQGNTSNVDSSSKEDDNVNEAIKRSLADQQTGVINASGHEVVPDVDAPHRQRLQGEPAFLKHMLKPDFLPALITVIHSMTKLSNYFLRPDILLHDYGHNPQWWSGEGIDAPKVAYYDDATMTKNTDASCPPVIEEFQRLMAFLSQTQRAYGSAEALSRVHAIKILEGTGMESKSLLFRFLETMDAADPSRQLFSSTVIGKDGHESYISGFEFPSGIPNAGKEPTLIELLDNIIWERLPNGDFEADNFLGKIAPVQVLTIPTHSTWRLRVPMSLYLDRYLYSNQPVIARMKEENAEYIEQISKADAALKKLQTFKCSPSSGMSTGPQKEGDAVKLMEDSLNYLKERAAMAEDPNANVHEEVANERTINKLQMILDRVRQQVQDLNEQKQKALEAMKQASDVLTVPGFNQPSEVKPTRQYILRGVATMSPRLLNTYVQYQSAPNNSQWWKLTYDTTRSSPQISKTIVSGEQVLAAAAEGIDDTMLVYGNLGTVGGATMPLPPQLQRFVERDNAAFYDELAHISQMSAAPSPAVPITVTGVRTRSDSGGSTSSMRVQHDEGIEMDDRDQPPPYEDESGTGYPMDVKMESEPEMQERPGEGRPGLFNMRRSEPPKETDEMEGP